MKAPLAVVGSCLSAMIAGAGAPGGATEFGGGTRPKLDLNGTWEFRMDPADEGMAQGWSSPRVTYPDTIQVPGNWQAQGFGQPWRQLRHNYQGKAWYRRTVRVPADWQGRRLWLCLGGVVNTAEVFVNGRQVGSVDGFLTPHEFDVTDAVAPRQEAVIACRVDSTGPAPLGMFNFFGRWGGLYRRVWLEARSDPAVDDVFVMPDVTNAVARVRVVLRRAVPGPVEEANVRVDVRPVTGGTTRGAEALARFPAGATGSDPALADVAVPKMRPWSPEDPFLYTVSVTLVAAGKAVETVEDRFGMRQFTVGPGGTLLLNGKPYFVRGLGDDCVEVLTGTAAPDKQLYLDRIRLCKRYGYNGFRYLAHTPTKEIFDAADEAGFLIMAEGEIYGRDKSNIPLLKRQVARIARAYRNRPSWYIWSAGNELFDCQGPSPDPEWRDYIQSAHDTFKRLDPTRFFVASDGADVFPTDIITQAAKFGAAPGPVEQPFFGAVDEVAYFRRALSADEMRNLASPAAGYAARVKLLEPAGYWPLDETTPGTVVDASGHGHNGVHEAGVKGDSLRQAGALGGADPCLATGPGGQSVSLRESAQAFCAEKGQPFSVSLWVKPDGFRRDDWGTPFSCGAARDGGAFLLSLDGQGGDGRLTIGRWMDNILLSQARLTAGQWNHIGVSYDGSSLRLFLNGRPDAVVQTRMAVQPADARIGNLIQAGTADMSAYVGLPRIWHEFPNTYVGPLPDLSIDARYTGVFRDDGCLSRHRQELVDFGLADRYPDLRRRSNELFYQYLKTCYESARNSPALNGYAYWLMTDLPGGVEGDTNSCGVFSVLCEPDKFPDPAPILRFNRESVLLCDAGPDRRVLAAGEKREVVISLSHYGQQPVIEGRLEWQVRSLGETLARRTVALVPVQVGEVKPVARVPLGPYDFPQATKLTVTVRLRSAACRQENEWDLWFFPARPRGVAGQHTANRTGAKELDTRYACANQPVDGAGVVIADRLSDEVLAYLARGGRVVLLAETGGLTRPLRFTYWPEWIRQVGSVVEEHAALGGFPHDDFCGFQFFRLFGDGLGAVDLTAPGVERGKLTPIIWGLKTDYDPALGLGWSDPSNRWKYYRAGLLCEGTVGSGHLLVCSLRVLEGVRKGFPEGGYLLDCLMAYAVSGRFRSETPAMTAAEARETFPAQ